MYYFACNDILAVPVIFFLYLYSSCNNLLISSTYIITVPVLISSTYIITVTELISSTYIITVTVLISSTYIITVPVLFFLCLH